MKLQQNKENNHKLYRILQIVSVTVIVAGLFFSGMNIYKYAKGFFAYKTSSPVIQTHTTYNQNKSNNIALKSKPKDLLQLKAQLKAETELTLYPERPSIGDEIGQLEIPKLNITLPIFEGASDEELEKGVGHYANSVLPGENDNAVLSGHRDTVFRKLGQLGEGDWFIVRTSAGEFKYKVNKVRIVDEDDRTVIVPKPRAMLTVTTCYPFNYIGSAPQRYILVAYLAEKTLY